MNETNIKVIKHGYTATDWVLLKYEMKRNEAK